MAQLDTIYIAVRDFVCDKVIAAWTDVTKIHVDDSRIKQDSFPYAIVRLMDDISLQNLTACTDQAVLTFTIAGIFEKEAGKLMEQTAVEKASALRVELLASTDVASYGYNPQVVQVLTDIKSEYGENLVEVGILFEVTIEVDRLE